MKWWIVIFLILAFAVLLIVLFAPRGNYEPTSFPFILSQLGYGTTNLQDKNEDGSTKSQLPVNYDNDKNESSEDDKEKKEEIYNENKDKEENNKEIKYNSSPRTSNKNDEIERIDRSISPKEIIPKSLRDLGLVDSEFLKELESFGNSEADVYSRIDELINVEELKEEWREMQRKREEDGLSRSRLSMAQYICQKTFETIFAKSFPEVRPEFLTNPETYDPKYPERSRLELDGFNEELMVAFEYNGQQHYEWSENVRTKFKMSKRDFVQQCRRDIFKKEVCKAMDIILLIIPYKADGKKLKYEDIPLWIANHLDRKLDKYRHDLIYL